MPGISHLVAYYVIKQYLGTANEAISVPIFVNLWSAGSRPCPSLIGWPRCQIRISRPAMAISISIPTCHRQKTMPLSFCQSGFASLPPKAGVGCLSARPCYLLYCGTVLRIHDRTPPPATSTSSQGLANTPFATAPLLCVLALDWQLISALRLLRHCDTATAVACPVRSPGPMPQFCQYGRSSGRCHYPHPLIILSQPAAAVGY